MFSRFLLTLLSSWFVNPLGILLAHHFGIANTPTVILLLLGAGACVPFQLLMNECLAVGVEHGRFRVTHGQLAGILGIQSICYLISVGLLSPTPFSARSICALGLLLAASTYTSYATALSYYNLVIQGLVSMREAVLIGALPGLTALLVYLTYCLTAALWTELPPHLLLLVVGLPAVTQFLYVRSRVQKSESTPTGDVTSERKLGSDPSAVSNVAVVKYVALLSGLAMAGTYLRESIANQSPMYTALVLTLLNSLVSLANTVTRSRHFAAAVSTRLNVLFLQSILAFGFGAALMWKVHSATSMTSALIATQLCVIWAVERGRSMRS